MAVSIAGICLDRQIPAHARFFVLGVNVGVVCFGVNVGMVWFGVNIGVVCFGVNVVRVCFGVFTNIDKQNFNTPFTFSLLRFSKNVPSNSTEDSLLHIDCSPNKIFCLSNSLCHRWQLYLGLDQGTSKVDFLWYAEVYCGNTNASMAGPEKFILEIPLSAWAVPNVGVVWSRIRKLFGSFREI